MRFKHSMAMVAACAGGLALAGDAYGLLIDNFDSGAGTVDSLVDPGPTNFASVDAIGGSRTLEILGFPTDGDPLSMGAELSVAVPPGALGHSQDVFAPGGRSKVTWDSNGAGLGGLDLTDGGLANGLSMDLLSIDVGTVDVTLMVEDTGGGMSSLQLPGLVLGTNNFFFASFSVGADFTDVESIMMTIEADESSDLVIDFLETIDVPPTPRNAVPEPITASLGLMGLGALGYTTRRRGA